MIEILLIIILIAVLILIALQLKNNQPTDYNKIQQDNKFNNQELLFNINNLMQVSSDKLLDNNNNAFNKQQKDSFENYAKIIRLLNDSFGKINDLLKDQLYNISKDMNDKINKSFEKTNTSFTSMIERLSKIDEAQKKIESLSTNIISLQDVLTDKKTRGIYGEIQLSNILKNIFGEPGKYYYLQKKLSNDFIVDALIDVPDPVGKIAIDSKFPLENYQKMVDEKLDNATRTQAAKLFKQDMKNHIDAISRKYIIKYETAESAIMFLPAEAIFAHVNAYNEDVLEYAYKKHVWIASPTTIMATLTSIQVLLRNIEATKYTEQIHLHLNKLKEEFTRYEKRWQSLSNSIGKVSNEVKDITTTTNKISREFTRISDLEFEEKEGDLIE
ncbi:DNA recombination protein RmuC [Mycoplasma sp. P36-A1]|uniref:DNA recombination protein RmuC n=1 Tax=Mycoplasma sp. P36-A1 TaxID=3252900 RepID=UPI003C2B7553